MVVTLASYGSQNRKTGSKTGQNRKTVFPPIRVHSGGHPGPVGTPHVGLAMFVSYNGSYVTQMLYRLAALILERRKSDEK